MLPRLKETLLSSRCAADTISPLALGQVRRACRSAEIFQTCTSRAKTNAARKNREHALHMRALAALPNNVLSQTDSSVGSGVMEGADIGHLADYRVQRPSQQPAMTDFHTGVTFLAVLE